jgi:hypothetical protein
LAKAAGEAAMEEGDWAAAALVVKGLAAAEERA